MQYEITDRTTFPYSAITYIEVTFPNGFRARGSGVVIGPNDVLTAMHVVFDATQGGWARSITVMPGADTSPRQLPYGSYSDWGKVNGRTTNWDSNGDGMLYDSEAQWDLAVIGMKSPIGDQTGWIPVVSLPNDFYGVMVGYPARGTGMMAESVFADASSVYGVYDIRSDLGPGASGGPLLYTSGGATYVAGVLSSGAGNGTESTYAGLFGTGTWDWLMGVMAGNDDLIAGYASAAIRGTEGNDRLVGDSLANTISGLGGNDWIQGGPGDDVIDGGAGIDVAVFTGVRSGYTITIGSSGVTVADRTPGRDGTDSLTHVERLWFSDLALALDLTGNAGVVAKTIGAVLGRDVLAHNKAVVGIGLQLADSGMAYADLVQLALRARLGDDAVHEAVVHLLHWNLTGSAPSAYNMTLFKGMLESGAVTQAGLALAAAESALNVSGIDLVGLSSTGLEFSPFVA
jgi:V8-like Glu-specific endopeptidase